jgi:hypothetical protein
MMREVMVNERTQIVVLAGLSIGVLLLTAVAYALDQQLFDRLLGKINPLLAIAVIVPVGGAILTYFLARGWFAILTPLTLDRFLWPALLATLLAVLMMLVDSRATMSEEINAPFPLSILYYPVVAYAAQIVFHIVPLFLLLGGSRLLLANASLETIIWPCIIIVSLIEPLFQTLPLFGSYPVWAAAYIFVNVWVINITQLWLFNRFDFVTMYSFRLVYYLFWHIIWGHARLSLLF